MDRIDMQNPAYKIYTRSFLKKSPAFYQMSLRNKNTHRSGSSSAIKNKSVDSLQPTRHLMFQKKMITVGVMTEGNSQSVEKIKSLTKEKDDLVKKLQMKRSQMIELNLKYLSLKQKIDIAQLTGQRVVSDNISNLSGFGDISNISEMNNTSISKKSKAQELAAIKARLQRLNLRKLTEKVDHEPILPINI